MGRVSSSLFNVDDVMSVSEAGGGIGIGVGSRLRLAAGWAFGNWVVEVVRSP